MPNTKDYIAVRSLQTLLKNYRGDYIYSTNCKVPLSRHMLPVYKNLIEDIDDIYMIEINKISPRKWQVVNISTENNSYNTEDDELFLSPANFDLKVLSEQVEIYQYNSFLGIHPVWVSKWELERFPDMYMVYYENGKEITQSELKTMSEKVK